MNFKHPHPFYILIRMVKFIKDGILPIAILAISALAKYGASNKNFVIGAAVIIVLIGIIYSLLQWKNYCYSINDEYMLVKHGIVKKVERKLYISRIQTMDTSQPFYLVPFKVVLLQLDAAGGSKDTEISLHVSTKEASNIKELLLRDKKPDENELEKTNLNYKASFGDLILMAVTSKSIFWGFIIVSTIYDKINDWIPKSMKKSLDSAGEQGINKVMAMGVIKGAVLIIAVIVIIAMILSIVGTIFRYGNFTVIREKNNFKIFYGLLDKKEFTIPIKRIQSVSFKQGLLRKALGLVSINIESIGYGKDKGESTMLFPIMQNDRLNAFLEDMYPEIKIQYTLEQCPKASVKGYIIRMIIIPLIIFIGLTVLLKYGWISLLFLPLFIYLGIRSHKLSGIAITEKYLIMKSCFITLNTSIISKKSVQSITKAQNPIQVKNHLVDINAVIQSETMTKSYKIKGLSGGVYERVMYWLLEAENYNI